MVDYNDDLTQRIAGLESEHASRKTKRRTWKALRRGIDPRAITNRELQNVGRDLRLKTNDSTTYFDLVVHMLSGRPIQWKLASRSGESERTLKNYANAEYFVAGILEQNNERLLRKGAQRLERMFADSVCETGVLAYSRASSIRDGELVFKIEPINPASLYERFDDDGLVEIVHEFVISKNEFLSTARREVGWNQKIVEQVRDSNYKSITLKDYYEREIDTRGETIIRRGMLADGELLLDLVATDFTEMPFNIFYSNGEAFPDDMLRGDSYSSTVAKSILDANSRIYTDISDFLTELNLHMQEVLTAPVDEGTHGGRPVSDPSDLDPSTGERRTQAYDTSRGESGRRIMQIPPLDQSTNIIVTTLEGMRQRGSVSDLLHGNLNVALSGFAISQVLEAALATSAESRVIMQLAYSDLGKWIIDTFRDSVISGMVVCVDPISSNRREFFYEEVKPTDMPARSLIKAEIELATPSNLTERINNARTLDPSGGPVLSRRSIWEHVISDLVPDPAREAEDLNEQRLEALPEVQQLEIIQSLITRIDKATQDGDSFEADVLSAVLDEFRELINPNKQPTPEGVAAGIPPTQVLPTAQRTRGSLQPSPMNNIPNA